ncbi:MAG: dihydrofolate reductase [Bernardetiaceae bacterium]|jgi:dihydrofolate reductase|nr:dihydrofolate reductase [Bernardetiaceae bacterium]
MLVSAIVAQALNGVIGHQNALPWHLPADLQYFKRLTTGHHLIMGRKTFESIGRPLPNRVSIVLSRQAGLALPAGVWQAADPAQALELARTHGETEVFVIGGAEVFAQMMPWVQRVYLTEVLAPVPGDVTMPPLGPGWHETQRQAHPADERHAYAYAFVVLEKKPASPETDQPE